MSQAPVILPGPPLPPATAAMALNAEFAAMISKFLGASSPPQGPGISGALVKGQDWIDTSVTPNVWRQWDGAQWCGIANIDPTLHTAGIALPWRNIVGANGGFEVWQRGAGSSSSFAVPASTTQYTADRWYITTGTNQASTVNAVPGLTNQSQFAAKVQRNSGQAGTGTMLFACPLEDTAEISRMRGQFVSLAFTIKAGNNWSGGTVSWHLYVATPNGPAKRGFTPYTGETVVLAGTSSAIAPGQQILVQQTSTVAVQNASTQAELQFTWTPAGTAGADDSITIDDVQLEVGGMASPFERMPFDVSLMMCKRHFWKTFIYATAPAQNNGANTGEVQFVAAPAGTTQQNVSMRHPVPMRATPTMTGYNPSAANAQIRDETAGADCSATLLNAAVTSEYVRPIATGNASTAIGNVLGIHMTADAGI